MAEERSKYIVTVAGIGPGAGLSLTKEAENALDECDVIVGYPIYLELLRADLPDKEYLSTPMRQEEERCRMAFEEARKGKKTVLVCGGDAGVYGLASLMQSLSPQYSDCEVKVIPGVSAAMAGAALLGAPLTSDFAVISLSDALTPTDLIEKRLRLAAEADLVICIYNPSSRGRRDGLKKACLTLLETVEEDRVCGVARQIGREGEECRILTLKELKDYPADMFTTVFIGNSATSVIDGKMVTPRGYEAERRPARRAAGGKEEEDD